MAKQYKVLINAGKADNTPAASQEVQIQQFSGDKGQPVRIKSQPGAKYQLQEMGRSKPVGPDYVKAKRVGKDLHILFEDEQQPSLIIEDYYADNAAGHNGLIGQAENGRFYDYIPEDPRTEGLIPLLADGGQAVNVALGGVEVTPWGLLPMTAVGAPGLPWLGALGLLGAAGAAGALNQDSRGQQLANTTSGQLSAQSDNIDGGQDNDNKTADSTPTLTGTAPVGSTVTITLNGQTHSVAVGADGRWTFQQPAHLPDGTYYPVLNVTQNGVTTPTNLTPFTIDTTPPVIAITVNKAALASGETATITFALSEAVADFTEADVTVTGGTLSNFQRDPGNPLKYTATFVPTPGNATTPGTATISVASSKFSDAAGNLNTDGADLNNTVTLAINASVTGALDPNAVNTNGTPNDSGPLGDNLTNDNTPTLTGKVPVGSTAKIVINGEEQTVTPDAQGRWTYTVPNGLPDGTYTPQLIVTPQGSSTPNAPVPLTPFTIDTVPPSIAISAPTLSLLSGQTTPITFTLSEPVSDFDLSDVIVTGGTLSNLVQSPTDPKVWTATFTPAGTGTSASISLPSNRFRDAAGNLNADGAEPDNTLTLSTNASLSGGLAPVSDNVTGTPNDNQTNDATPELAGKVPVGSTAVIKIKDAQGNVVGEGPATVNPDGTWRFTQPNNLPDGTYSPEVIVTPPGSTTPHAAAPLQPFVIDTTPPTVIVSAPVTALAAGASTTVTFTLSEVATDLTDADFHVTGGTLGTLQQSASNPLVYTATFTSTTGGAGSVSVASNRFSDAAGNLNQDGAQDNNTWVVNHGGIATGQLAPASDSNGDGIANPQDSDNKTSDPTPLMTGTVPPGTTSAKVLLNGVEYPATLNPDGTWTAPIDGANLPDGTYYPVLQFTADGRTTHSDLTPFTIDTTPPVIAITANKAALASGENATITFTFNEPVSDFTLADVTVNDGTLGTPVQSSTDPKVWTATFIPAGTATSATISVASSKFSDAAGNLNTDGADLNNTVTLAINASVTGALDPNAVNTNGTPSDSGTKGDNLTSDPTPTLKGTVPPGSTAKIIINGVEQTVTPDAQGNWTYTVPNGLPDGTYTPQLIVTPQGSSTPNAPVPLTPFTIDTVPPSIEVKADTALLTAGETATVTFILSDVVNDFSAADIVTTGGTLSNLVQSPTDPKVWTATFTPAGTGNSATISVASGKFSDAAANFNVDTATNPAPSGAVYELNNKVTLTTNAAVSGSLAPVSDNATGVPNDNKTSDPTPELAGKVPNGSNASVTIDGVTYPVEVSPDGSWSFTQPTNLPDGTYTPILNVTAGGVTQSTPITPFTIDTTPPTVIVSAPATALAVGASTTITFTLSEASTDFTLGDIQVTGGTLGNLQGSGTTYTATFTSTTGGAGSVSVASNRFSDAAGNLNQDGAQDNNTWVVNTRSLDTSGPGPANTSGLNLVNDTATAKESGVQNGGNTAEAGTNPSAVAAAGVLSNDTAATSVTGIAFNSSAGTLGQPLAGQYGSLTLHADGSYTYTLNNSTGTGAATVNALQAGSTLTEVFTYTATDGTSSKTANLSITINGTNDAPTVAVALADQTGTVGTELSYVFDSGTFADVDTGDTKTYTAQLVDGSGNLVNGGSLTGTGLSFDADTRTFSGTPTAAGTLYIKVTNTDSQGATASVIFNIVVTDATRPTNEFVELDVSITTDANDDGYVNPAELAGDRVFESRVTFNPQHVAVGDKIVVNATNGTSALAEQIVTLVQADIDRGYVEVLFAKPLEGVLQTVTANFVDAQDGPASDAPPTDSARLDATAPAQPTAPTTYADDAGSVTNPTSTAPVTDDNKPGLNIGQIPAGETPKLYVDGQPVDATYDPQTGTLTPTAPLADGPHNLAYSLTDPAGNESPISTPLPVTVDTTAPAQPAAPTSYADDAGSVTNPTSTAPVTDDNKPGLNIGQIPAGETPKLYVDGQPVDATYDPQTGTLTPIVPLADGLHNLAYSLTDPAGNESPVSNPLPVTVDTTAPAQPAAPTSYADDAGSVTNPTSTAPVTDDNKPGLNIGPGLTDIPTLYVDGQPVDATYDPQTGRLTPTAPLADGPHTLAYSLTDPAGNESQVSDPLTVTVDTTAPAQPAAPTSYADDAGSIQNPASTAPVTDDSTPGLNIGQVPAGETPKLYVDGVEVPSTYDPQTGRLTPTAPLADGTYDLAYSLTDPAGNESQLSPPISITVDAPPTNADMNLTLVISTDADDNGFVVGQEIGASSWFISRASFDKSKAAVGDQIVFTASNGTTVLTPKIATLTADDIANGYVDINFTKPAQGQTQTITANYVDAAGNVATDARPTDSATLDSVAPTNAGMSLGISITTDTDNNAWVDAAELQSANTFTSRVTFDGNQAAVGDKIVINATNGTNALPEQTVTLTQADVANGYIDVTFDKPAEGESQTVRANYVDAAGNTATDAQPTDTAALDAIVPGQPPAPSDYADNFGSIQDPNSTDESTDDNTPGLNIGQVPAGETPKLYVDGQPVDATYDPQTGTLTPTNPLADGPHDLSYSLTDPAGNESPLSDPLSLIVDTTAAAQPAPPTSYADNIGTIQDPTSTAPVTDDNKPGLNIGQVPAGETPKLYVDGVEVPSTYDPLTGTLTPNNPLVDGPRNLAYKLSDSAGNESPLSNALPITVDTTAGNAAISLALSITTDTNNNAWVNTGELNGALTFTSRATFDRTKVAAGDRLVFTAVNENGSSYEEVVVLTAQDLTAGYVDVDFLKPANGRLQTVTVNLTDAAGNVATDTKPTDNARLDTTAPATPTITRVNDDVGASTGSVAQGALTDDNRPTVVGTAEPNSTVTVFNNGTAIGTTTADQNGDWTFTPTTPLPDGNHSFTAQSTDPAGNQSGVTAPADIDVSTVQVAITNSTFTSTTVAAGQVIETFDSAPYEVTTNGSIQNTFGDGNGLAIMFNQPQDQTANQTDTNFVTFTSLNVTRVQFNYYDLQLADKTITYYAANGSVIRTQNMGQVGNGSGSIDSGNLGTPVKYFGITGGVKDLYSLDRFVINATNVTTNVSQTVSSGSTVVTTAPTLNGTLSRALAAGETLRVFANGVDVGAATVNGTSWTFNASLPTGTTVDYSAKVVIGGVAVSESSDFRLTQSSTGVTPLVIDLNGDGVQTTTLADGVQFDLLATGSPLNTAWVDRHDGLLAIDLNGDGVVNSGAELLGSSTRLADGTLARDGWQALAQYDVNADGLIDAQDAVFGQLRVWVDADTDGLTDAGELRSLAVAGIQSISLQRDGSQTEQNGNILDGLAAVEFADGRTTQMTDVWFSVQQPGQESRGEGQDLDALQQASDVAVQALLDQQMMQLQSALREQEAQKYLLWAF